jgi:metallophosphoesterase (TIGR03767 family)
MRRRETWGGAAVGVLAVAVAAGFSTASAEVAGKTTLETTIRAGAGAFKLLNEGPGEPFVVRAGEGIGRPQNGRESRRHSLLYFAQLSDFQLADEESPSRVETVDSAGGPVSAAWRPMEALGPHTVDAAVRQVNAFAAASPVAGVGGRRAELAFAITTGDSADNQQLNETQWVVRLLDGGTLNPNSGVGDGSCGTDPAEAPRYTGVSDLDDYLVPGMDFYDPDDPQGAWAAWPRYPGLLDRAQQPFETPGLDVPVYVTFGNHDALAQGNQAATQSFESVATGCVKPIAAATGVLAPVPPDPARRYVSKREYKAVHKTPESPAAHGFGFLEASEEQASGGSAGYYAWSPSPGFHFIALDTVCEGGVAGPSADGNVDHPQFEWLEGKLKQATARDELVVLFSHHAIASLTCSVPDEAAPPCGEIDEQGHPTNPGCDLDPRDSGPLHLGEDLTTLLHRYPHVIAWVAGHSHVNSVDPFRAPGGGGFWSIRVAAEIDWPQQSRLLEVMDNRDGTLSLFGTILDHGAPVGAPPADTATTSFGPSELASLSRVFAANDPQGGVGTGEGESNDRNVELLVGDPRRNPIDPASGGPGGQSTRRCASLRGRLAGRRLHRARLGARRRAIRRRYPTRSPRRRVDVFCLADGKRVRVAYRRGRAVLILTSSRKFRARGVRPGMRARRLRGRARRSGRGFYVARRRAATLVFRVRRGRVVEVGIAQRRLTATRARTRRLLRGIR